MRKDLEGWTLRVSETVPHDGKPGHFAIGKFYNGAAELWRCFRGGRFFWKMPKTEDESVKIIRRYATRTEALAEAKRIASRDRLRLAK